MNKAFIVAGSFLCLMILVDYIKNKRWDKLTAVVLGSGASILAHHTLSQNLWFSLFIGMVVTIGVRSMFDYVAERKRKKKVPYVGDVMI